MDPKGAIAGDRGGEVLVVLFSVDSYQHPNWVKKSDNYLSEYEISFCKLNQYLLGAQRIVKLCFDVFIPHIGTGDLDHI
jgi:hypothetical protein